jgi:DNA-binding SARP family transcriptional activator/TolB-like protein/Tfp pilus assembly protein PilF
VSGKQTTDIAKTARSGAEPSATRAPEAGPDLRISLLGPFELRRAGALIRLPKKAQGLLAVLAVNRGQPVPKETLATLFWGNSGTDQARQSFRQCLAALRAALGPLAECIASEAATLALLPSDAIVVDAHDFAEHCKAQSLPDLERANALYRDAFLAGMHIPIEPFERWLTIERQRFESMRLDLLLRLAAAQAAAGHNDKAVTACRQLISLDPLREEGHRLLMTLLASTGNRGGALLQYEQCAEILKDELGVDPDPETIRLAETIRLGTLKQGRTEGGASVPTMPPANDGPSARIAEVAGPGLPDKPSIAVLPFANLSGDTGQDYFVRGLVEDITVALGHEKWLFVIASPSAFMAGHAEADARMVGAKLGVHYLLKGSVRIEAGQVLFVVQLIDAARGGHVWSGRFRDQMDNIFSLQDRLATKVAAVIAPALVSVEIERALHKPTARLTAFDLYLRALPRFRTSPRDNEEALELLAKAIEFDPSYAAAHAMSARCYQFQLMFGWRLPGDPDFAQGVGHCHDAASKGRNDSEALWMAGLALVHLAGEHDFSQALIERSLSLNPNSANAWTASCLIHSYLGNTDTAIDHFQKAQRLNPLDLSQHLHWNTIAWAYLGAGRYEEAAEAAEKTLHIQPDYPPGLRLSAVTCGLLGRIDEARAYTARMLAKQPNTTISWMRAFLRVPLQRNTKALEKYVEGARLAGVPEGN